MRLGIVVMALLMVACGGNITRPSDVLSKEEMVKVLTEVYLAEEKVNRLSLTRDSSEKVFEIVRGKLFEKTGVADSVFRNSVNYYLEHPKELEEVYTALVDSLNLQEQRANVKSLNERKEE